jgi:hypothetical protein
MSTIYTRATKGSALTWTEGDANITNLNNDKLENIVADTTPQLGGNLDVNGNSIVSTANADITIAPNGTGDVHLVTDALRIGDLNTEARISTYGTGNLVLTTNEGNDPDPTITIGNGANADITLTPSGTGNLILDGLNWPQADGTANYVLKTNGSGQLSWTAMSGGGGDVVTDTTPQLGGDLDVNGFAITTTALTIPVAIKSNYLKIGEASATGISWLTTAGAQNLYLGPQDMDYSHILINKNANGNISIVPNGTGKIILDGLSWPTADGTSDQVLKTDGAGNLSFVTVSSGATNLDGLSDVVLGTPVVGEVLYHNGTNWVDTAISGLTAGNVSGTVAIANGGTGATTRGAAKIALEGLTSTVTSNGTTTLTNTSTYTQVFTGTSNQTLVLPSTATLAVGWSFYVVNNNSNQIVLQTSTGASLQNVQNSTNTLITCLSTADNTAASWEVTVAGFSNLTGSGSIVMNNSPTLISPILGTPSSGTVTNLTGTASININGTVGATTPSTGAFTTLSASSTVSGTGFSTYLASPPAIGGTTAAAGRFTAITTTNTTATIVSESNGNIVIAPNGTGQTAIKNLEYQEFVYALGTTSGTIAPDAANGNVQTITLNGNLTINAFTNPVSGQTITLIITTGGTGRTLTSSMLFAGASKTLSTTSTVDILTMSYIGTTYYASLVKGYA